MNHNRSLSPAVASLQQDQEGLSAAPLLKPGHNCYQVAQAGRAAVLLSAAEYFAALEQALLRARRSVILIGWDFDGDITLRADRDSPSVGPLLRSLVEAQPELEIRLLIWSTAVLHGPSAPMPLLMGADWQNHPRIHLHLDTAHPIYGAHHQKIVCIDGCLGFAGGIDLTVERWDSRRHRKNDSRRRTPDDKPYGPVHDLQMAVDGDAARVLEQVARDRWLAATGETLAPVEPASECWPSSLRPHFKACDIGVARTAPARDGRPAVGEVKQLTLDALAAARNCIYIEAQYFSQRHVGDVLAEKLAEPDGPEIVVITTHTFEATVERLAMGSNRDRLIRRLRESDRDGRLRVYHPAIRDKDEDCEVLIHAKLIIVDNSFLRVGSSNLNNRSFGLDTECDLGLEGADAEIQAAIAGIRDRLLACHLGIETERFTEALAAEGSMIGAIEALNHNAHCLLPFEAMSDAGPTRPMPGTGLIDPSGPYKLLGFLRR